MVYHKIRRGENLGLIAAKYGVSVNQLRDWNNISGNKIMSGRNLRIYSDEQFKLYCRIMKQKIR